MEEKEYQQDRGYTSRKFILVLVGTIAAVGLGLLYPVLGWNVVYLDTVLGTLVALILGYCGISAGRVAIPKAVSSLAKNNTANTKTATDKTTPAITTPLEDEA
jgi:uncharacterized membrane protein YraQ (UPF0718 family)